MCVNLWIRLHWETVLFLFFFSLSLKEVTLESNNMIVDFFFFFAVGAAENAEFTFALCFLPTSFLDDHIPLLKTGILRESVCHILYSFL